MPARVQSPTSIITYKQCPRKYYYQYILKIPTRPSIHLVRGKVAHSVLEEFYEQNVSHITKQNYRAELQKIVAQLFVKYWHESKQELDLLGMDEASKSQYFEETVIMLLNWLNFFSKKVQNHPSESFQEIFKNLTPEREQRFFSEKHQVQGYIDVLEQNEGETTILDYKTSNKAEITDEYRLQLAIYSLLYFERFGKLPRQAGLFFLKYGVTKYMNVDASLVQHAKNEVSFVHSKTTTDSIDDYRQNMSPLCKWSTGCCDFYDYCFKAKVPTPRIDVPLQAIEIQQKLV